MKQFENGFQIIITTTGDLADLWSDVLLELGANAVTLESTTPTLLPEEDPAEPYWEKTYVIGLFSKDSVENLRIVQTQLQILIGIREDTNKEHTSFHITPIPSTDWENAWKQHFQPTCFGDRFWICQSFRDLPDTTLSRIVIDPGMAFGTGLHPSTQLCLNWIANHYQFIYHNPVIDYGCGSGILGLAALAMGATKVYAIDNDPLALTVTEENAKLNGYKIGTHIQTFLPEDFEIAEPVPVLLANILANPLKELSSLFAQLVQPGGYVVLAGILNEQCEGIINAYEQHGFRLKETISKGEWAQVVFQR